jgi:hypothetical protein
MAYLDSAFLLADLKALLKRPTVDEETTDAALYLLLTQAQLHWVRAIAAKLPELMMVTELITSGDSGLTFTLDYEPIGPVTIMHGLQGYPLTPGSYSDSHADYVPEGLTMRMVNGRARTFSNGLYARYVPTPGVIDGSTQPTLKPTSARVLLPPRAALIFASQGGLRDPSPYIAQEKALWEGTGPGDEGILGDLAKQGNGYAVSSGARPWWRSSDLGYRL